MHCHFLLQGIFPSQGSNLHLPSSPALQSESLPLSQLVKSNLFSSEKETLLKDGGCQQPLVPGGSQTYYSGLPLLSHGLHPMCLSEKTQCWTVVTTLVKTRVYPEMIAMGKRNLILELGSTLNTVQTSGNE